MLSDKELTWTIKDSKKVLVTPVYDVIEQKEVSGTGVEGEYMAIKAPDWVMVIPVIDGDFVLVRQWRHAEEKITMEFPGGVMDRTENPRISAERELLEETGFKAGRFTYLGMCSPNPALFKNHFHCYLAENLEDTGVQNLDDDEILNYQRVPVEEVISNYGKGEYSHALMGAALAMYTREKYVKMDPKKKNNLQSKKSSHHGN